MTILAWFGAVLFGALVVACLAACVAGALADRAQRRWRP